MPTIEVLHEARCTAPDSRSASRRSTRRNAAAREGGDPVATAWAGSSPGISTRCRSTTPRSTASGRCLYRVLGEGCTHLCQIEVAWRCPEPGQPCQKTCGNGQLDGNEVCDDGNTLPGDGCDPDCGEADGRSAGAECGDAVLQMTLGEECDLGTAMNTARYGENGCTPTCRRAHYCGDALVDVSAG